MLMLMMSMLMVLMIMILRLMTRLITLMLMVLHDGANGANNANANLLYSMCLGQSVIVLAPGTLWDSLSQCWDRLSRF